MRRDYLTYDVTNVAVHDTPADSPPTLTLNWTGDRTTLVETFTTPDGEWYDASDLVFAMRLHGPIDDSATTGVVTVTHATTGALLCEVTADATDLLAVVMAARERESQRETETPPTYRVTLAVADAPITSYDVHTFILYEPATADSATAADADVDADVEPMPDTAPSVADGTASSEELRVNRDPAEQGTILRPYSLLPPAGDATRE